MLERLGECAMEEGAGVRAWLPAYIVGWDTECDIGPAGLYSPPKSNKKVLAT